jgi:hypothetical protein
VLGQHMRLWPHTRSGRPAATPRTLTLWRCALVPPPPPHTHTHTRARACTHTVAALPGARDRAHPLRHHRQVWLAAQRLHRALREPPSTLHAPHAHATACWRATACWHALQRPTTTSTGRCWSAGRRARTPTSTPCSRSCARASTRCVCSTASRVRH